ncbi:MAG: hypothetical protein M0R33_18985 [Methylomonas sp.]|uniref:hypothetical protein n=1 Tax=Methylomonas sp. TaxID=418 RepID=UPI0025D5291C|nr:hypothetical protein [Methylomonas sp.]MCK9608531.1 hypothetical protein [Methylomonas sp.]
MTTRLDFLTPFCEWLLDKEPHGIAQIFQLRLISHEYNAVIDNFLQTNASKIVAKILTIYEREMSIHPLSINSGQPPPHIGESMIDEISDMLPFPSPRNLVDAMWVVKIPIKYICLLMSTIFPPRHTRHTLGKTIFMRIIAQEEDDGILESELHGMYCDSVAFDSPVGETTYDWSVFLPLFAKMNHHIIAKIFESVLNSRVRVNSPVLFSWVWHAMFHFLKTSNRTTAVDGLCVFCDYNVNILRLFAKSFVSSGCKFGDACSILADTAQMIEKNPQKVKPSLLDEYAKASYVQIRSDIPPIDLSAYF